MRPGVAIAAVSSALVLSGALLAAPASAEDRGDAKPGTSTQVDGTPGRSGSGARTGEDFRTPSTVCFANQPGTAARVSSQDFERRYANYDNAGADDFTLTTACTIKRIRVTGEYFFRQGPGAREADMHITFYEDSGLGVPGAVLAPFPVTVDATRAGAPRGTFRLRLPPEARPTLEPGTYWLSVQLRMDFRPYGEWGWSTTNVQSGSPAVWQNPGEEYEEGCVTWDVLADCGWTASGPDFKFRLAEGAGAARS